MFECACVQRDSNVRFTSLFLNVEWCSLEFILFVFQYDAVQFHCSFHNHLVWSKDLVNMSYLSENEKGTQFSTFNSIFCKSYAFLTDFKLLIQVSWRLSGASTFYWHNSLDIHYIAYCEMLILLKHSMSMSNRHDSVSSLFPATEK